MTSIKEEENSKVLQPCAYASFGNEDDRSIEYPKESQKYGCISPTNLQPGLPTSSLPHSSNEQHRSPYVVPPLDYEQHSNITTALCDVNMQNQHFRLPLLSTKMEKSRFKATNQFRQDCRFQTCAESTGLLSTSCITHNEGFRRLNSDLLCQTDTSSESGSCVKLESPSDDYNSAGMLEERSDRKNNELIENKHGQLNLNEYAVDSCQIKNQQLDGERDHLFLPQNEAFAECERRCFNCRKHTDYICHGCHAAWFCNHYCQMNSWYLHRKSCRHQASHCALIKSGRCCKYPLLMDGTI